MYREGKSLETENWSSAVWGCWGGAGASAINRQEAAFVGYENVLKLGNSKGTTQ